LRSRPFAWSGRRRIDGAIRCRQLQPNTFRRTAHRHLFSAGGCELLVVVVGPWGAFTEPRRPLTFSWSLEGTPDRPLCRPIRCPPSLHRSGTGLRLTFEPKDFNVALPVRTRRAKARECLPSYRELASRNPQAEPANTFLIIFSCSAHRFAVSPLVPASGGAFELPSG
jgi:hypothetical protein